MEEIFIIIISIFIIIMIWYTFKSKRKIDFTEEMIRHSNEIRKISEDQETVLDKLED
jgi:hypothetical protein